MSQISIFDHIFLGHSRIKIDLFDFIKVLLMSSCGLAAQSVSVKPTGCGFDPHSKRWNIYLNLYFHFFALVSRQSTTLSSATQHEMPPEIGRKWETERLSTRFPLLTLLCAGFSVKLTSNLGNSWSVHTWSGQACYIWPLLIHVKRHSGSIWS